MRSLMTFAAGVLLGGLVAAAMSSRARPPAGGLAPDPDAVHYRFPIAASSDLSATIAALEKRIADFASPFEMAELADLYYRRAQAGGDRDDYEAATSVAKRSLAILRTPNPAILTLAKLANARHDFHEAIALAHEQLARKKTSAAYIVLATAHLALGALPEATEAAHAAIATKPDGSGYLMRALVLQAAGRDAEAETDFARAASLEEAGDAQGAARLRALWARFLIRRGELAGAQIVLDEALRIVPRFPLATAYAGELALRRGHARDAAALFEQAFASSRQVRYLIDQARALELAGGRAEADALRAQVEVIVRGEGALGHGLDLVEVLVDRGTRLAEAVALGRDEVARRPSADARFQLARALARSGHGDEARTQVQAALATGAHEAQLYELASRLEAAGSERAAMYAREAARLDPGDSGWRRQVLP